LDFRRLKKKATPLLTPQKARKRGKVILGSQMKLSQQFKGHLAQWKRFGLSLSLRGSQVLVMIYATVALFSRPSLIKGVNHELQLVVMTQIA
jgi:hypothetical protein